MIDAGKLRQRITIQQPNDTTQNTFGEVVLTDDSNWTTVDTLWAEIETLTGRELYAAQRIAAEATHKVTLRYYPGIIPKQRVLFGTRIFDVNAVLNIEERNIELHLLCKESL